MFAISGLPLLIVFCGCMCIVKESARFLIAAGHYERAFGILDFMIMSNKGEKEPPLSDDEKERIKLWAKNTFTTARKGKIRALFQDGMAPITSRIWAIWFLINAMYYGQLVVMPFILGQTTKSFLGYFLTLMGEAPSIIVSLYIVDVKSLGRKNSLVLTLAISTVFHILCYVISKKHVSFMASATRFFMK